MRWAPKAAIAAVERARTYLNPEVSQDGLVTCELVSPGLSEHQEQQGSESKPLRWQNKDHQRARGPLVIGGADEGRKKNLRQSSKAPKNKASPQQALSPHSKVYGGGTLPPGWEHLGTLRGGAGSGAKGEGAAVRAAPLDNEAAREAGWNGERRREALSAAGHDAAGGRTQAEEEEEGRREEVEALYAEAEAAHHDGDFAAASRLYEEVLSLDGEYVKALSGYAMLMRMRGQLQEAEALYQEAIRIDGNCPDALCGYGLLLRTINRHDEAEAMYQRALAIDEDHVNTLCSYGAFMHTLKNDPDEAERMYLKALKIDPHHVDSICNYAALKHVVRKDLTTAEVLYRMGLEENPDHVGILYNYSSLLEEMDLDTDRAQEMYDKAMRLIEVHSPGLMESETESGSEDEWDEEDDDEDQLQDEVAMSMAARLQLEDAASGGERHEQSNGARAGWEGAHGEPWEGRGGGRGGEPGPQHAIRSDAGGVAPAASSGSWAFA